jgi:hypothetical protein
VSRRDERQLAVRLARVLDGEERGTDDVRALVAVLERATEPARFVVPEEQVEEALRIARPRLKAAPPARRPQTRRFAFALAAAGAAAAALLVYTFVRVTGVDVEGKALAALSPGGKILDIEERVEPAVPGTFPVSTRTVSFSPSQGRMRSILVSRGRTVEETLVTPGRVSRYLPGPDLVIVAPSCRAFASGCADIVDPVAFYRRALETQGVEKTKREGDVYVLTLPIQTLPDAVRIEQRVTIDAKTFLPKVIEWREQRPGGKMHAVSRIVIVRIQRLSPDEFPDPFHLSTLDSTRIEQRNLSRVPLRRLGKGGLTLTQARRVTPTLIGLGTPRRVEAFRYNLGTAYRLHYGDTTVWNYRNAIPPVLVSTLLSGPTKPVPLRNTVAHFYEGPGGRWLVEVDTRTWSVVISAPAEAKGDIFRMAGQLRPLK